MKAIRVEKLRVGSFAKVVGIVQAIIAFIYGAIITLSVIAGQITSDSSVVRSLGVSVGVLGLAVVLFPAVAYVIGWVQGAVAAIVLNFAFKEGAHLDIEVSDIK